MPYPSLLLNLPLHAQERLPQALRNIDLEYGLVLHICLAFFIMLNPKAPIYNLPLALFGLVASQPSLISGLLPHFLGLWTASILADILWLLSASDVGGIATLVTGVNMIFKLVTAGAAAKTVQSQGALPEHSAGNAGIGNWGAAAADRFGSLPGYIFGGPGGGARGGYTDVPGGYQSVYDEEEPQPRATERDARPFDSSVGADMLPGAKGGHRSMA